MKAEIILYGGETYLKSQEKKCLCNQSSFRVSFGYSLHVSDNLHLWRREMRENMVEGERREGGCKRFPEPESNVGEDAADASAVVVRCWNGGVREKKQIMMGSYHCW